MRPDILRGILIGVVLALALAWGVRAEDVGTWPSGAGIVDVTKAPYNAAGDGRRDDTEAIQRALDAYPNGNRIIYLPKGTYLISNRLDWPAGQPGASDYKRVILQGESAATTTLRLRDRIPAYGRSAAPKAMIYTGPAPAQRFRNAVRHLTLDVGRGNPGAIGLQFNANNQGAVEDVVIRSGDGQGAIGLDFSFADEIGPLLVKNLTVEGFQVGIQTAFTVNSMTFEHIRLRNQLRVGIHNRQQVISIRDLDSSNRVSALVNDNSGGVVTLVEANLRGGDPVQPAIRNGATLFARQVRTSGYGRAIENTNGSSVDEFVSAPPLSLCANPGRSLRLPIQETPEPPRTDPSRWVSPLDFGARGDGQTDDTEAFQRAVDSGAEVVYLPPTATFQLNGDVQIRGNVSRVLGTEGNLSGPGGLEVADGRAPVVFLERFNSFTNRIRHTGKRTVVLKHLIMKRYEAQPGAGSAFLEDNAIDVLHFRQQTVWARQLNPEAGDEPRVVNDGGTLWILGLKTERGHIGVDTRNGGRTEVLGGHIYQTIPEPQTQPLFRVQNGSISLAGIRETSFAGHPYQTVVEETRAGTTRRLSGSQAPGGLNGSLLPLFLGYGGSRC